jgi:hypothetical protein
MSATDNTDEIECGHCTETFDSEADRADHWYFEHRGELSDEEAEAAIDEGTRRDDECDFEPEVHIDVPRRTFERALKRARIEESVDDVAPYEHGEAPDELADQIVEFYLPDYVWHVKDDED